MPPTKGTLVRGILLIAALQVAVHTVFATIAEPVLQRTVLKNSHCMATINLSTNGVDFGTVESFTGGNNATNVVKNAWFRLHAGEVYASSGRVLSVAMDTVRVALDGFGTLGLHAVLTYYLKDNSLQMEARMWVDRPTEFNNRLEFDIETGLKDVTILSPNLLSNEPNSQPGCTNSDLNPMVAFSQGDRMALFLIRNPFHAFWRFDSTGSGSHRVEVVKCLYPVMREQVKLEKTQAIGSTIGAYDTLYRHIEVFCNRTVNDLCYLGEHVDGFSPAITMFWDELPNFITVDNWKFMTTADTWDVQCDHFLLRLLRDHPKLKMGYALMADRILDKKCADIAGWKVNSPYVVPDSLDEYAGTWCVQAMQVREKIHTITRTLPCAPSQKYSLSWYMKTSAITSIDTGAFVRVTGSCNNLLGNEIQVTGTTGWQKFTNEFTSAATDTFVTVSCGINTTGGGSAWFDEVALTDTTGSDLITNGGFEVNYPYCHYDSTRRHWVDVHGREHIVAAPEPYKAFLRRIENDSLLYGWEHRIRLGCHGYHHTPSVDKTDSIGLAWEFQQYDPAGDALRVAMTYRDFYQIGLTKKSLLFWRTPGIQYTKSVVDLLVDSGVVFMDPYFTDNDADVRSCFIERNGKRMWLPDLTFWADYNNGFSLAKIEAYLRNGHLGHIGGHPGRTFLHVDGITAYTTFHQILTNLETMYPSLRYVFPDEYGDNANAVYDLSLKTVKNDVNELVVEVTGRTTGRNTFIAHGTKFLQVVWNGLPVENIRYNGNLCYIVLPQSDNLKNTLTLKKFDKKSGEFTLNAGPPRYRLPAKKALEIILFDLQGRMIKRVVLDENAYDVAVRSNAMLKNVARGTYVCSTFQQGKMVTSYIVVNF